MLTLQEALTRAAGQLAAHPLLEPTALQDAVVLLMATLGIERAALIAHPERPIDREEQAAYQRLLERRLRFEPIQYILGETEFYGLRLKVGPGVLIPRPETELLVEMVIGRLQHSTSQKRDVVHPEFSVRIVDVGTGSGAIAIALAAALPRAEVTAVDLSAAALEIARENAALHGLSERIRFKESDLLRGVEGEFDAVVSNPPYLPEGEELHPQVREFEPGDGVVWRVDGAGGVCAADPGGPVEAEGGWFAGDGDRVRATGGGGPVDGGVRGSGVSGRSAGDTAGGSGNLNRRLKAL